MEPTFIKFAGRFIDVDDENRSISPLGLWSVGALAKVADVPLDAHFPRINKSQSSVYNKLRRLADSSLEKMSWVHGAWANMARATPGEIRLLEVVKDLDGTSDTKIPTQDYLDEWANLNSFGLLQKHPTITPGTVSILSNILALNLTWDDFFAPAVPNESMAAWGQDRVLEEKTTETTLYRFEDKIYGVLRKRVSVSGNGNFVVTSIIGPENVTVEDVTRFFRSNYEHRLSVDEIISDTTSDFFSWKEVTSLIPYPQTIVQHPAWSSDNSHQVSETVQQQVVVDYNARGFKAAAVTSMMGATSAMAPPTPVKTVEIELNFHRPFYVFADYQDQRHPWNRALLFMSKVNRAAAVKTD